MIWPTLFFLAGLVVVAEEPMEKKLSAAPVNNAAAPAPLQVLPVAAASFGLPPEYARARLQFDAAKQTYDRGDAAGAAPMFIQVASLLRTRGEMTYSEAFKKMRLVCYHNARTAFAAAGKKQQAQEALSAAAKEDAQNRAELEALARGVR
jgi:hypothetical protein